MSGWMRGSMESIYGFLWIIYDSYMEYLWIISMVIWIIYGCMDRMRVSMDNLHGYMDNLWFIHGVSMDNLYGYIDNLWFIYGVSMDNLWLYG